MLGRAELSADKLLVKCAERRATLLGLNPPLGHAVTVVQHSSANYESSTDRIEAVLAELEGLDKAHGSGAG